MQLICFLLSILTLTSCFVLDYSLTPKPEEHKGVLSDNEKITYSLILNFDGTDEFENDEKSPYPFANQEKSKYLKLIGDLLDKHDVAGEFTDEKLKSGKHLLIEIHHNSKKNYSSMELISEFSVTVIPGWAIVRDHRTYQYSFFSNDHLVFDQFFWVSEDKFSWILTVPISWLSVVNHYKQDAFFEQSLENFLFGTTIEN